MQSVLFEQYSRFLQSLSQHKPVIVMLDDLQWVDPGSIGLAYRDRMVRVAQRYLPGRVGINIDGFAARYL